MSYDYSERFSNWQVGGAAVKAVEVKVVEEQFDNESIPQQFSENLYSFVTYAADNSFDTSESLYSLLSASDWQFIWSVVEKPLDWNESSVDFNIEYLLCEWYDELYAAVASTDTKSVVEVELVDSFGFDSCSTTTEVKSLYRQLCKQHHPDMGGNREQFEYLTHCYEMAVNFHSALADLGL